MFAKLVDVAAKIELELGPENGMDALSYGPLLPNSWWKREACVRIECIGFNFQAFKAMIFVWQYLSMSIDIY